MAYMQSTRGSRPYVRDAPSIRNGSPKTGDWGGITNSLHKEEQSMIFLLSLEYKLLCIGYCKLLEFNIITSRVFFEFSKTYKYHF